MSGRMFKYQVFDGAVEMREGAVIRAVGMQNRAIYAWAEVPYDVGGERLAERTLRVVATGRDVPDPGVYLGTVFDGPFVWHIYETTS